MTLGWIVAATLYALGIGLFGWASTMRKPHDRGLTASWGFVWPLLALVATILWLFPVRQRSAPKREDESRNPSDDWPRQSGSGA